MLGSEKVTFLVCATEERNCIGSEFAVDPGRAACVARRTCSYLNSGRTSQKTQSLSYRHPPVHSVWRNSRCFFFQRNMQDPSTYPAEVLQ